MTPNQKYWAKSLCSDAVICGMLAGYVATDNIGYLTTFQVVVWFITFTVFISTFFPHLYTLTADHRPPGFQLYHLVGEFFFILVIANLGMPILAAFRLSTIVLDEAGRSTELSNHSDLETP